MGPVKEFCRYSILLDLHTDGSNLASWYILHLLVIKIDDITGVNAYRRTLKNQGKSCSPVIQEWEQSGYGAAPAAGAATTATTAP